MNYQVSRPDRNQLLSKSLMVGALSTVGWLLGLVPSLSALPEAPQSWATIDFGTRAYAQAIDPREVNAFVRATLDIELAREATLRQNPGTAQFECDIASGRVININSFPSEIRQAIESLCNQSQSILQQNRLSAAQFREIKDRYERNPQQYPQITAAFGRLCQQNKYKKLGVCSQ